MDPKIAKKTQDTLGKIIKKPPLTDKLLGKPPFRFLHDIMTSVIKTTGFMQGLFTETEMNSENVKDKDAKIAFLQKAIDMVSAVIGKDLSVRPAKIVAGHEPEKTNEFLQALTDAINKNVDNDEYVKRVLKGGKAGGSSKDERKEDKKDKARSEEKKKGQDVEEKGGREKESKKSEPSGDTGDQEGERKRDRDRDKDRHRDKKQDKDREKDRHGERRSDRDGEKDREKHRERERESKTRDKSREGREERNREKDKERSKKLSEASPHTSKQWNKPKRLADSHMTRSRGHTQSSDLADPGPRSSGGSADMLTSDLNCDAQKMLGATGFYEKPSSARKGDGDPHFEADLQETFTESSRESLSSRRDSTRHSGQIPSLVPGREVEGSVGHEKEYLATGDNWNVPADRDQSRDKENESPGRDKVHGETEERQETSTRLQRPASAKGSRRRREGHENVDDLEGLNEDEEVPRPREPMLGEGDLPPQVVAARQLGRPSSARPAPPRPKQETLESEPAMRLGSGQPAVVIADNDDDDDDDNFLVQETAPPPPDPDLSQLKPLDDSDTTHGALVQKMLESKKEVEKGTKKTEIERPLISDAQRRKQREIVQKEVDKLRLSIQNLTRSANPLGKVMDYVQEDMDSMQQELDKWRAENAQHALELKREMNVTDRAIDPLRQQLAELDRAISDQLDRIATVKSNIIKNDQKIQKMLQGISSS